MRQGSRTIPVHQKRPIGFVLLGLLLLAGAGWLVYDLRSRVVDTVNAPSVYAYTVHQNIETEVSYFSSSFYDKTPGFGNTAYVADLTDTIKAKFHYQYRASREADLTATFLVVGSIHGKYILGSDGKDVNNVWSKDYRLVPAEVTTITTKDITIDREITIPFSEYKKTMEQFRLSLQLPVTTDMQVLFSVHVKGTIDGSPIDDRRSSVVSAPLDQPLYKLSNKFDKDDKKQVAGKAAIDTQASVRHYERIAAAVLCVVGLGAIAYGMRRQIFKSPYQRELDKIYRYHDGLIIKASSRTDITNKTVVPVQSFDDILNLEEELKSPIIASSAGPAATHFMIIHNDIIYMYTLGRVEKDQVTSGRSLEEIEAFIEGHKAAAAELVQRSSSHAKNTQHK